MSNVSSAPKPSFAALAPARAIPIVCAFLLGVVVIGGTGFVQMSAAHNAAHDHRHSIGFPCH